MGGFGRLIAAAAAAPLVRNLYQHSRRPSAADSDDSDVESSSGSSSGSESEPQDDKLDDKHDDNVSERNSERTESWAGKLYEDVWLTLKDFIHEVFLAGTDCPACGAEYEPIDWDAIARGELDDGVAYY